MPDPTGRVSHLPDMHRGVAWKEPVRVATNSNIAITGQGAGAAIDGVTLAAGDRILLKNQTAASSNGLYLVRSSGLAAIRAFDMDQDAASSVPASEVVGAVVQVVAGGSNGGTFWRATNTTAPTIGTDAINWLHMPFGGGLGGPTSIGSNATDVSGRTTGGAAATFSLSDHEHRGIATVTSSSSNTLQRPTLNLRSGTGIGITATDSDGNGEFDTVTITNTGSGSGAASGGITQEYLGYNTAGASFERTNLRVYAKKITVAASCLITSIGAYVKNDSAGADDQVEAFGVGLYTDNAGTPQYLIATHMPPTASMMLDAASGATGDGVARWVDEPLGTWVTPGDYWIAVILNDSQILNIAFDGSGSDRYYTSAGAWFTDWGFYTPTTSSNRYSIRANTIR